MESNGRLCLSMNMVMAWMHGYYNDKAWVKPIPTNSVILQFHIRRTPRLHHRQVTICIPTFFFGTPALCVIKLLACKRPYIDRGPQTVQNRMCPDCGHKGMFCLGYSFLGNSLRKLPPYSRQKLPDTISILNSFFRFVSDMIMCYLLRNSSFRLWVSCR